MKLSEINIEDIKSAINQTDGTLKKFLSEIIEKEKEIRYINENMILEVFFIPNALRLKKIDGFHHYQKVIPRNINEKELRKELELAMNSIEISYVNVLKLNICDWYNMNKKYQDLINVDDILMKYKKRENNNILFHAYEKGFGLSINILELSEKVNISVNYDQ